MSVYTSRATQTRRAFTIVEKAVIALGALMLSAGLAWLGLYIAVPGKEAQHTWDLVTNLLSIASMFYMWRIGRKVRHTLDVV